ncbi:hypothetical protein [Paludisphaera rhizosphaerae]|uniref:hypothetical protein n=1 Tax=Paludisphaera rhizosphaerae TaxID=2711216 RepID=UPI0013EA3108|nr:hypothetical protein [Paludisphaera rhizosphaerae]
MLAVAAVAGVLAITPPQHVSVVAFFFGVTTPIAFVVRRAKGAGWLASYGWVVVLYPLIALTLVYFLWFVIWIRGGMPPGVHPRNVGGPIGAAYAAARFGLQGLGVAVCAGPSMTVMCIGDWVMKQDQATGRAAVLILSGIAAWILLVGIYMNDATRTFQWFLS